MTAPRLAPGAVVGGKYRVQALLAYGGSSASYQAASTEAQVALKMLSPQLAQRQDMMSALQQFYAGTNSLSPELVVPIVDAGYDQTSAAPFSATELMRTPTLAQLVAQRPLSAEEVTNVLTGLAKTVDAAHLRQMAHHALKPNNVFIGAAPYTSVRVMDFGASLARSITPTQEGYELSAPWMAPEQVQATTPAGAPADIFSSALLAFFALTGRSYWLSCQGPRPDVGAWQREVVSPPVPISQRAREVGFPFGTSLDLAFARALATNPLERFRTVGEFAAALSVITMPRPTSSGEQTMAFPMSAFEPPPGTIQPAAGRAADAGYPPPPVPMGAAPQGQAPMGGQPMAMGQPGQYGQAPQPPGPPVQAQGPGPGEMRPALMMTQQAPAATPSKSGGKAATVVVIVVAVLLLGGVAAAFVFTRNRGAAEASTATVAATSATATGASVDPSATASVEPAAAPVAAPSGAPSADADAGAAGVAVTLSCDPACGAGEIKIDDADAGIDDPTAALNLPPGKHKIAITKDGFVPKTDTIVLVAGKPFTKEYKLAEKAAAATGPAVGATPPSTATKPCGKFLKKCK